MGYSQEEMMPSESTNTPAPRTWRPDICIYHANCIDGFTAAWAVYSTWVFGGITFVAASYGDPPPDVAGRKVLLVDFTYKIDVIRQMSEAADSIVILDHHKSAEADLREVNRIFGNTCEHVNRVFAWSKGPMPNVVAEFDEDHSGAVLAWRFCRPDSVVPDFLQYVEDRDLWRFNMRASREINAYISSLPREFDTWSEEVRSLASYERAAERTGAAILRVQDQQLRALLDATARTMYIGGHKVPVANVPFFMASDAGNILAEGNPFAATYCDLADGRRQFSLRSERSGGIDVSVIAARFGGGGHRHAAGFTVARGWEGGD